MKKNAKSYKFRAGSLGYLEGLTLSTESSVALHYFGGLPYALPPIGLNRFRHPRKLPSGFIYGTEACPGRFNGGGNACPQPPSRNPPDPSTVDEDCLQLNIWIPAMKAPKDGWPVLFYIHGGFLQVGSPNWKPDSLVPLLGDSAFKAIVVMPAYRLNVFGFLAGKALASEARSTDTEAFDNMGLWDQRMALKWVHENVRNFNGDPSNITIGGYSAGAYSSFYQLAHELYQVPARDCIIRRVIMLSNGPGARPRTLEEHQAQFDELVSTLNIPASASDAEKLARLRALPWWLLVDAQRKLKLSEFKPLADGVFSPQDLFAKINSGDFGRRMQDRGISLLSGECRDEHTTYRNWRTPDNSFSSLRVRLCAEYPEDVVESVLRRYCGRISPPFLFSSRLCEEQASLPPHCRDWQDLFGRIYADLQVHGLQRGFYNALCKGGGLEPGKDFHRYSLHRRVDCVKATLSVDLGVTHTSDLPLWFWGSDFPGGLTEEEKKWLRGWNETFAAFVKGERVDWGLTRPSEARRWKENGETDVWEDDRWEEGLELWSIVHPKSRRDARLQKENCA